MKIEKRKNVGGIVQITTLDERWYLLKDKLYPSVTWISGYYPKGIHFYKWLADKGWDEAEAIKSSAGDKGSKIHSAIEMLLNGETITFDQKLINPSTSEPEEITVEEYEAVMSFVDWYTEMQKTHKLEVLSTEFIVTNKKEEYAGTVDFMLKIDDETWIIDFKTGQNIWPEYELQISAYKNAIEKIDNIKMAVLQVGYKRNQRGWKFNEIEDKYDLFLHAKAIWKNENPDTKPKQKDYPTELKLAKGGDNNGK